MRKHCLKDIKIKNVFGIGVACALTIAFGCLMRRQIESMDRLEEEREELVGEYARLSALLEESKAEYEGLTGELEKLEKETGHEQKRLELYKSLREYDNEIFYGDWSVKLYGTAGEEEQPEGTDSLTLSLQKDGIMIAGEIVTTEPVYFYNVRAYTPEWSSWDIFQEISFDTDEVKELFQKDYYIELMLDQAENWERELEEPEKSIINNAIYYMLDENTMLCFAQDSRKIYQLSRQASDHT